MATYDRHKISVGSRLKVGKIRSGTEINGVPYWKFYVPFTKRVNGNAVTYKHLWCKVSGRPLTKEGEWVEITKILSYHPNCRPNDDGGMQMFEDLVVEVEKVVK